MRDRESTSNDSRISIEPVPFFPFEKAEYQQRLAEVRRAMVDRQVDFLITVDSDNIYYLTGFNSQRTAFECLIVGLDGEPSFLTWDFEAGRAAIGSWLSSPGNISWDYQAGQLSSNSWASPVSMYTWSQGPFPLLIDVMKKLGARTARCATDMTSPAMNVAAFTKLSTALPKASFIDAFGIIEGRRLTKSAAELHYMRQAAELTDQAVDAGLAAAHVGVPDTEVAAAITSSVYRNMKTASGTKWFGPTVAAGQNAGIGHTSFTGTPLSHGDTIFLELSVPVFQYIAPVMRTAVLGRPTREMRDIRDSGLKALDEVLLAARPGIPASNVARAGLSALEGVRGRVHFHDLIGYSVGIGYTSGLFERLGYELDVKNDMPLQPGMVFHIPISLRKFGAFGVGQSQTLVITDAGSEFLSTAPAILREIS